VRIGLEEYRCLAVQASHLLIEKVARAPALGASRESALTALRLADMLTEADRGGNLEGLRARYSPYLLAALSLTLSGDRLLSSEATLDCGTLSVEGPLGAIALTILLSTQLGGYYVAMPLTDDVRFSGAEAAGVSDGTQVEPPIPGGEDRILVDEVLPPEALGDSEDVARAGVVGAPTGAAETGGGGAEAPEAVAPGGLPSIDVRGYVERILGALTGDVEPAPGSGAAPAAPPAPGAGLGESIGNIVIDYRLLAELSEILGEAGVGVAGGVEVGIYAPGGFRGVEGPGLGLPLLVLASFGAIAAMYVRRDALVKIARRIGVVRGVQPHPVEECYAEALAILESRGLGRRPWETAREHYERVRGALQPVEASALENIVSVYEVYAYSGREPGEEEVKACISSLEVLRE
jgi:hypothetical protein